jgi:predicted transcriptional regulator
MTLKEIKELLKAEIICGEDRLEEKVEFAGGSDMMSDVLAFGKPGILLLTGLTNAQSVRTADIIEAKAIVYVRGKIPDKEGIALARKKGIPILSTNYMMYKTCGVLYKAGLAGVCDIEKK